MASLLQPCLNSGDNLKEKIEKAVNVLKYSDVVKNILREMLVIDEKKRKDFLTLQKVVFAGFTKVKDLRSFSIASLISAKSRKSLYSVETRTSTISSMFQDFKAENSKIVNISDYFPLTAYNCKYLSSIMAKNSIKILDIEGSKIEIQGFKHLLACLPSLYCLFELNLSNNYIEAEGIRELYKALLLCNTIHILRM